MITFKKLLLAILVKNSFKPNDIMTPINVGEEPGFLKIGKTLSSNNPKVCSMYLF